MNNSKKELKIKFYKELERLSPDIEKHYEEVLKSALSEPIEIRTSMSSGKERSKRLPHIPDGVISFNLPDGSKYWNYSDLICSYFRDKGWFVVRDGYHKYLLYTSKRKVVFSSFHFFCSLLLSSFIAPMALIFVVCLVSLCSTFLDGKWSPSSCLWSFLSAHIIFISSFFSYLWFTCKSEGFECND